MNIRCTIQHLFASLLLIAVFTEVREVSGQEPGADDPPVTREQFDETIKQWKAVYKEAIVTHREFHTSSEEDAERLSARWKKLKAEGDKLAGQAIDQAVVIYQNNNIQDQELLRLLAGLPKRYFDGNRYEKSARIGQALLRHNPNDRDILYQTAVSSYFANQFDQATELIAKIKAVDQVTDDSLLPGYMHAIDSVKEAWKLEQEIREEEAKAEDLPIVEIETPKGKIVFELFENEAPKAVNSFVHLIETDYFRNMNFCHVLAHQFALSGCPYNNGTGGPDYQVLSEAKAKDARKHFRGTVGLVVNQGNQTVGSQFYFCKTPIPEFDGQNLALGRVIEGMDIVDDLAATHAIDPRGIEEAPIEDAVPDRLTSIRVVRKRDHEYRPEKVEQ